MRVLSGYAVILLITPCLTSPFLFSNSAYAQRIGVDVTYGVSNEPDFLRAPGIAISTRHGSTDLTLRRAWSTDVRMGSTCGGFFPGPRDCTDEVLDISGVFTSLILSWLTETRDRPIIGHFTLGVGAGILEGTRSGRRTGRDLRADIVMPGLNLGVGGSLAVSPWLRARATLTSALWLNPLGDNCEDCYQPYGALGELGAMIGLEYRLR